MTKEELKTIEEKVLWELENNPLTRNSDKELAIAVYMDFYNMTPYTPFVEVMYSKLPNYETLGRARRKIQEPHSAVRFVSLNFTFAKRYDLKFRLFCSWNFIIVLWYASAWKRAQDRNVLRSFFICQSGVRLLALDISGMLRGLSFPAQG